ncbi:MAG: autotransporter outer membrane beta-barrel domain-containing protein [bacterium]
MCNIILKKLLVRSVLISLCVFLGQSQLFAEDDTPSIEDALISLSNRTGDPLLARVASSISKQCRANAQTGSVSFREQCRRFRQALFSGDQDENIRKAIRAWLPDEALALGRGFSKLASLKVGAIQARMTQLRAGQQSNVSQSPDGLEMGVSGSLAQLLGYASSGDGIAMQDRWGFFSSVSYYKGERDIRLTEPGFWYHGGKIGGGIDYRINQSWVVGATIGRSRLAQHLLDNLGQNDSYSSNYGLYTSWNGDRIYADAFFVRTLSQQKQVRRLQYSFDATLVDARLDVSAEAESHTKSNVKQWGLGMGYDVLRGKWNLGVVAGVKWADSDTDPYAEFVRSGETPIVVRVEGQHVESQIYTIGSTLNRAFSQSWGVITTELDVNLMHEAKDNARTIRSFLINGDGGIPLELDTLTPDRDWGELGATVTAVLPHSTQVFLNHRRLIGVDGFTRDVTYLGGRIDF